MGNASLSLAKKEKQDDFYTRYPEIEDELRFYSDMFRGKRVYCNCDNPLESNFFKYFVNNFEKLGLKKLNCTCFAGDESVNRQLPLFVEKASSKFVLDQTAWCANITTTKGWGGTDLMGLFNLPGNRLKKLKGNGSYSSSECVEILDKSDIVVTNPPFSLFRDFVSLLVKHDKKFLIIGNLNAVATVDIFPLIKNGKIWLGRTTPKDFTVPNSSEKRMLGFCCWYTNLGTPTVRDRIPLTKSYSPAEYSKYQNYNAIEVSKTADIPMRWDGAMGVPVSFIQKHNPEQFTILGCDETCGRGMSGDLWLGGSTEPVVDGVRKYSRIFVKHNTD